jgi:hypothetical protein
MIAHNVNPRSLIDRVRAIASLETAIASLETAIASLETAIVSLKEAIALNAGFAKRAIKVEISERAISSTLVALDLGELSIRAVALSVHHSL